MAVHVMECTSLYALVLSNTINSCDNRDSIAIMIVLLIATCLVMMACITWG